MLLDFRQRMKWKSGSYRQEFEDLQSHSVCAYSATMASLDFLLYTALVDFVILLQTKV